MRTIRDYRKSSNFIVRGREYLPFTEKRRENRLYAKFPQSTVGGLNVYVSSLLLCTKSAARTKRKMRLAFYHTGALHTKAFVMACVSSNCLGEKRRMRKYWSAAHVLPYFRETRENTATSYPEGVYISIAGRCN